MTDQDRSANEMLALGFIYRLANRLRQAKAAIETAISEEDGLDGGQGEDLITLIDDDLRRVGARYLGTGGANLPIDNAFAVASHILDQLGMQHSLDRVVLLAQICTYLDGAILEERERCAQIVENSGCVRGQGVWKLLNLQDKYGGNNAHDFGVIVDAKPIAAAIRKTPRNAS